MSTESPLGIHRLFNHAGLRKFLIRIRVPLGLAGAVWLAFNVKREWFWPGLAVSAVGELFQLWCFAALHKEKTLATNGPYKVVRNPMYLARFLIVFGCLMFLGNWVVLAIVPVLYYFYMVNRVRREEARLQQLLGEPYAEYCRRVSRFVPFAGISSHGRFAFFNLTYFLKNHGPVNGLAQFAYYAICYVITFKPFAA
jgi:protein-S-isoprenylcysteine O-methyltransferase Ste14